MNPFLEPTVATPQPAADWRRPARHRNRCTAASESPRSKPSGGKAQPVPAARDHRAMSRVLRALLLVGSLLLPGLASAVDINTATAQQLQEIKGIGPKTASIIVEERDRGGHFESITDVAERVKGIGPKKAASLEAAGLTVGAAVAAAGKASDSGTRAARRSR